MASIIGFFAVMIALVSFVTAVSAYNDLGKLGKKVERLKRDFELSQGLALPKEETSFPVEPSPPKTAKPDKPKEEAMETSSKVDSTKAQEKVDRIDTTLFGPELKLKILSVRWEWFFGTRFLAWVGAIAVLIGSIFLAKFAADHGLFEPPLRILSGICFGGVAFTVGFAMDQKRFRVLSRSLMGLAVGLWYLSDFAAYGLYDLISIEAAIAGSIFVTILAVFIAEFFNSRTIVIVGALGAYLLPILLLEGFAAPFFTYSYLFSVAGGLIVFSRREKICVTPFLSVAGMAVCTLVWITRFYDGSQAMAGILFTVLFAYTVQIGFLSRPLVKQKTLALDRLCVVMIANVVSFCLAIFFISDQYLSFAAVFSFGWSGLLFVIGYLSQACLPEKNREIVSFTHLGLGAVVMFLGGFFSLSEETSLIAALLFFVVNYAVALPAVLRIPTATPLGQQGRGFSFLILMSLSATVGFALFSHHEGYWIIYWLFCSFFALIQGEILSQSQRKDDIAPLVHRLVSAGFIFPALVFSLPNVSLEGETCYGLAVAFWSLLLLAQSILILTRRWFSTTNEIVNQIVTTLFSALHMAVGFFMIRELFEGWEGLYLLGMSVLYLLYSRANQQEQNRIICAVLGIVPLILFVPVQFAQEWIALGWAVEAVVFGVLASSGGKIRHDLCYLSFVLWGLVGTVLFCWSVTPPNSSQPWDPSYLPVINPHALSLFFTVLGAWTLSVRYERKGAIKTANLFAVPAYGLLLFALCTETRDVILWMIETNHYTQETIEALHYTKDLLFTLYMAVIGLFLLIYGFLKERTSRRWMGSIFLVLTVGKVFVADLSFLSEGYRVISFLALGVTLLVASYLYRRFMPGRGDS